MARWNSCGVRFLALVAALPWPAFVMDTRASASAPAGSAPPVISARENAAAISALPADRKPIAKGDRGALDGVAPAIAPRAPIAAANVALPGAVHAFPIADTNHPSCAFLCRFLV